MSVLSGAGESPAAPTEAGIIHARCTHLEHALLVRRYLLPTTTASQMAAQFAILSDPTRLQVVSALLHVPGGKLCVCDLAAGLGRNDTTISHQLRVLRHQHSAAMRKAGCVISSRLADEHLRQVLAVGLTYDNEPLPISLHHATEVSA